MAKEIERKFLLSKEGKYELVFDDLQLIKQGYIFSNEDKNVRVRLVRPLDGSENRRNIFTRGFICVKFTSDIVRDEFEYEIDAEDAISMYEKCEDKLEKIRMKNSNNKEEYDLDEYPNGLRVIEVEFKSVDAMKNWVKPGWFGKEITTDSEYSNIVLAKKKMSFENG